MFRENTTNLVPFDEDPLDIPTFLRKAGQEPVSEEVKEISSAK